MDVKSTAPVLEDESRWIRYGRVQRALSRLQRFTHLAIPAIVWP